MAAFSPGRAGIDCFVWDEETALPLPNITMPSGITDRIGLKHLETKTFHNGVVLLCYKPAGKG